MQDLQQNEQPRTGDTGGFYTWVSTPGSEESTLRFRSAQVFDIASTFLESDA